MNRFVPAVAIAILALAASCTGGVVLRRSYTTGDLVPLGSMEVTYHDCGGKAYARTTDQSGYFYISPVLSDGGVDLSSAIAEGPVLVSIKAGPGASVPSSPAPTTLFYMHKYDRSCPATINGQSTTIPCSADALLYRDDFGAANPSVVPPPLPADYKGLAIRYSPGLGPQGSSNAVHFFSSACASAAASQTK